MKLPDFIVIGAAKAGTTALYWYLAEHPGIFMSPVKETNFFAYALDGEGRWQYGNSDLHRFPVRTMDEYRKLFSAAAETMTVGEASPIYLECPDSAARIHRTLPNAGIICGLRDPVERAYSDYLMYLRVQGRRFDRERDLDPAAAWMQPDSHWMRASRYYDSLKRYYDRFPRERIHVFLFDELKRDACKVAQDVYRFLSVDENYRPDTKTPYNVGGVPSSMLMERSFAMGAAVRNAVEPWLPKRGMNWLRRVRAANMQKPPSLPVDLKSALMEHFRDDIALTAGLVGHRLDHWLYPPVSPDGPHREPETGIHGSHLSH